MQRIKFSLMRSQALTAVVAASLALGLAVDVLADIISGEWTYRLNEAEEATICLYHGSGGAVTIPAILDGYPVRAVGDVRQIFGDRNTSVTSVTIPEGVTNIGSYAFQRCEGLTSVTIPQSVTSIGSFAFYECVNLTSIAIPQGVTFIGTRAFLGTSLETIAIPITAFIGWFVAEDSVNVALDTTVLANNEEFVSRLATNKAFVSSLAHEIVANSPDNYGIATKSDLITAVSNAVSQTLLQVQADPNNYGLYSEDQYTTNYDSGVAAGTALVAASPESFNLFTSNSIMDLRMGGVMIQKQGNDATIVFQSQTTTDLTTLPFTNNGTPITNTVPMPGNKGFIRINAKPYPTPVVN